MAGRQSNSCAPVLLIKGLLNAPAYQTPMLNALNTLLDAPLLLLLVLALGAAIGIGVERLIEGQKRAERQAFWKGKRMGQKEGQHGAKGKSALDAAIRATEGPDRSPARAVADAAEQLRVVMEASFAARPLLNAPERRLLAHLDRALADEAPGWRAMGQVALGEILSSESKDAFIAINSKRVDLLIIDADCQPLAAVEFQGTGHHLSSNTAARDAVKKEALRRAGIKYEEIVSGDTPANVREIVRKLMRQRVR